MDTAAALGGQKRIKEEKEFLLAARVQGHVAIARRATVTATLKI